MATRALDSRGSNASTARTGGRAAPRAASGVADMRARRYDPTETKARVLAAAHMLFSRQGFAATGTADARRAHHNAAAAPAAAVEEKPKRARKAAAAAQE